MPTDFAQLPEVQESPTMVEPIAATQATETEPESPIETPEPRFEIRLTAVRSSARILRSGGIQLEVPQEKTADVHVGEGFQVVKLEAQKQQSYSILDFADDLEVELFGDTTVVLADLRHGAGDSTHVTLHLEGGHMFVHPNEQTATQVTAQTPSATIRILTAGTEFDMCYNEGLTCVFVKKGVAEVTAKRRKIIVKAGEAGYVLNNQSQSATICAPIQRFTAWEDRYRRFTDTQALDKEISGLPQEACPVTAAGLPFSAHIIYQDEFNNPFSGWARGRINNFIARYAGLRFYRVQAQEFDSQFLTFVPNKHEYGNVNINVKAIAEAENSDDFRYGLIFRRSGDQYYAFVISPVTKTWYFLKSSSAGLETLRQGTSERIRGLDARETLRVETYGSTFLMFTNDRLIDWFSDAEYASGEVGLFVESLDNPDVMIRFDSLIVWDVPPVILIPDTGGREYCFNVSDDDGDKLADRADPDCQRLERTPTPRPLPTKTSIAPKTSTLQPTTTPVPTNTVRPTNTTTPRPTSTRRPTKTSTPQPTWTLISLITPTPQPTWTLMPPGTSTPQPTQTLLPPKTSTARPTDPPPPTVTNVPPTDPPPTDPPPTDPPPTDPPPTTPPYP